MEGIVEHGLYKIKDQYFADFKREHWIDNKNENRPYYYLLKDTDGVMWVMPLSSQTENYKEKIKKVEEKRGEGSADGRAGSPVRMNLSRRCPRGIIPT